ncbi:MAG TPA: hypothetical protein VK638_05975, partial [Edaphobacter sp.]|nr:hypothetical protein [Edaphobacter sp.]
VVEVVLWSDQVVVLMNVGQLIEAMKAHFCFRAEPWSEIVIDESTYTVQPLPAVVGIEIREGAANV